MGTIISEYAYPMAALLLGGLATSLGATVAARTARGQAALLRLGRAGTTALVVTTVAFGAGAGYWLVRRALAAQGPDAVLATPAQLLVFGLLVGLPLGLPGVLLARSDARAQERVRKRRRERVPTREDRRAFAEDLVRQIHDVSPRHRKIAASVVGSGGRILKLEGDVEANEGERLTAALRDELAGHGFKRVEGHCGGKAWWTRV